MFYRVYFLREISNDQFPEYVNVSSPLMKSFTHVYFSLLTMPVNDGGFIPVDSKNTAQVFLDFEILLRAFQDSSTC